MRSFVLAFIHLHNLITQRGRKRMTYLGSFPQELCQSDDVGFELSLVGALTSHLQT